MPGRGRARFAARARWGAVLHMRAESAGGGGAVPPKYGWLCSITFWYEINVFANSRFKCPSFLPSFSLNKNFGVSHSSLCWLGVLLG